MSHVRAVLPKTFWMTHRQLRLESERPEIWLYVSVSMLTIPYVNHM